ncbi:hypothetical protein LF1_25950 [Rubripirellula obstinata]|uniref:Uncharacterized protein n=1 Tax=Rubripirellula obstinata TaxID=406547 RepID=A0A5B1CHN1_9BACT|nr:hypothetical protein LF1_25950 [Rubripirellula obstinata]
MALRWIAGTALSLFRPTLLAPNARGDAHAVKQFKNPSRRCPNGSYFSPGWGVSTVPWVLTHGIKRSKNRSPGWGESSVGRNKLGAVPAIAWDYVGLPELR